MKRIELKANRDLISSKSYRYGDLYDSWNQIQQDHFDGIEIGSSKVKSEV